MPRKPGYHYRSLAGTTEWVRPSSYIGEEDESARPARVNNQEQLDKQIAEEGYYYRSIKGYYYRSIIGTMEWVYGGRYTSDPDKKHCPCNCDKAGYVKCCFCGYYRKASLVKGHGRYASRDKHTEDIVSGWNALCEERIRMKVNSDVHD